MKHHQHPNHIPDLGTLWAEAEVSAPVAGTATVHRTRHIDNLLSIGGGKLVIGRHIEHKPYDNHHHHTRP